MHFFPDLSVSSVLKSSFTPRKLRFSARCFLDLRKKSLFLEAPLITAALISTSAIAAVLPEDRADILYHQFDGGGVTIDGPSVLVRKQFADKVSLWGNYYVDMISSASIDVMTQGSPYSEERTETSGGFDYLYDRTTMSLSYTNSSESDYEASTVGFAISQDFFGDMTTLSMNYSQGNDTVRRNIYENGGVVESEKVGEAEHQRFGIGLTQVLTKSWIMAFNAESVIDEGFLNNPYRQVRYLLSDGNVASQPEKYPNTRSSDSFALRSMYYLPYRASIRFEVRKLVDSWGIEAQNYELRYIHPYKDQWIFEIKYRAYDQTQADFYSDLFPYINAQTFLARDKEMSDFSDSAIGIGINYEIKADWLSFFDKTSVHFYYDYMTFDYANFRNNTASNSTEFGFGNEPLYSFDANVIRFFISAWY